MASPRSSYYARVTQWLAQLPVIGLCTLVHSTLFDFISGLEGLDEDSGWLGA